LYLEAAMESTVPRLKRLSPEELDREFLLADRPVILTDVLRDWPASKKWSFDYLRASFPDRELRVRGGSRRTWRLLGRVLRL
jgi:hypothetical protein